MSTITAKFPGTCIRCGQPFPAGASITWTKGVGSEHVACPAVESAPAGIEYLLGYTSMGASYAACGDRTDEFLARAAEYNRISVDEVRAALARGDDVVYNTGEITAYHLRDAGIAAARRLTRSAQQASQRAASAPSRMRCRSCGQTGSRGSYPFSTNPGGGHCDDCC